MADLLNLPWVQYAVAPFIAGLIVAELFNRIRLSGLALAAGLAAAVALSAHAALSLAPATPVERMVVAAAAATLLGLVFDLVPKMRRAIAVIVALAAGVAVIWVAWPAVTLDNWLAVLAPAGLGILYAVWTGGTLTLLADAPERAAAASAGLGAAIGACALQIDAPALVLLGFAAGSAALAYAALQIVSNARLACGTTFTLPASAVCALVPPLAVLKSGLSWYLLPALALVSAAALIPFSERLPMRTRGLLALVIAAAAAAGVAALAWLVIGPGNR